ncbi:MAG: class I SAM-dependent methyltransferase [Deltaproteobacteria bacterium]|nr:class I SAM-dependent methyltransferase [Deltaproteobacteria bacterium]
MFGFFKKDKTDDLIEYTRDLGIVREKFTLTERRFYHGKKRYHMRALECHAMPGTAEVGMMKLLKYMEKGGLGRKVLNLGGGVGQMSAVLTHLGFDVVNCDIEIKQDDERNFNFDFNSEKQFPYNGGEFDFIFCQEVVEHIENPWRLFRIAHAALKPGGMLLVTTPNILLGFSRQMFGKKGYFQWFQPKNLFYHINPIPYWEIELIADKTGFNIVEMGGNSEFLLSMHGGADKTEVLEYCEGLVFLMRKKIV